MKFVAIFILSFVLASALPLLWNGFSFVEAGFPFPYLHTMTMEDPMGSTTVYSYVKLNLVYDLVLVALFVWILIKYQTSVKRIPNTDVG